jgi:hypothetical protein
VRRPRQDHRLLDDHGQDVIQHESVVDLAAHALEALQRSHPALQLFVRLRVQARVLDRNRRLIGQRAQKLDRRIGKAVWLGEHGRKQADGPIGPLERQIGKRAESLSSHFRHVLLHVGDEQRLSGDESVRPPAWL